MRVVVKVGTNVLTDEDGRLHVATVEGLADQMVELLDTGHEVILVSSGAIGSGKALLDVTDRVETIRLRQALAAVGQPHLMRAWERALHRHGVHVAQLLLTRDDFTHREAYLNLRNTVEKLLDLGVVPVVNENDTVSVEEIDTSFGDNDRLSAYVATKVDADLLVLLTDVDGLHTKPPTEPGAERVATVEEVTPEVRAMAGGTGSTLGRGGMASKVDAARIATVDGVSVHIAHGRTPRVLPRILQGADVGTRFHPQGSGTRGKATWLRLARPRGRVHVDEGAADALRRGNHLLPAGVTRVEGAFQEQDVVEIVHGEEVVAKARSQYTSRELDAVKGARSGTVQEVLGRDGSTNVTRKGDLLVLNGDA